MQAFDLESASQLITLIWFPIALIALPVSLYHYVLMMWVSPR